MNRNIKRVALALIISTSSFVGTVVWFHSGLQESRNSDRNPVALLNESLNEVQRKPIQRVIWENVTKNENLYAGEAIRTTSSSEAKIRLLKSGTVIYLEPDSLVVLEETEKGLSLDFLEGNMYVQSSGEGSAEEITLKMGAGEVQLKSAEMSISKEQSGAINMSVFKGQAELLHGEKKISINKENSATLSGSGVSVDKDRMHVMWPTPGEAVLLNFVRSEPLMVRFKPVAPGYKVGMEWGASRTQLKDLDVYADGTSGKLNIAAVSGKWFMRLVAKSEDPSLPPLSSNIFPVQIAPKAVPTLLEPKAGESVVKGKVDRPIVFRWINRHQLVSQILEVATDSSFKKVVLRKDIDGQVTHGEYVLSAGVYYWRVTGILEYQGKKESLVSLPSKFTAQDSWELHPAKLSIPNNTQVMPYARVQKEGVLLQWQSAAGVKKFDVVVRKQKSGIWESFVQTTSEKDTFRITDIQPGLYQWSVSSWHPENASKKESELWTFRIDDIPRMEWAEMTPTYEYSTSAPSLRVMWKPLEHSPSSYRYKIVSQDGDARTAEWVSTKDTFFEAPVAGDGDYTVFVEALDEGARIVAQSEAKNYNVKKLALLPAPTWSPSTPNMLEADAQGNVSLAWDQVPGADHYIMVLEDKNGKTIEERKVSRTIASVNRLKPGQYNILLRAVDSQNRKSDKINSKPLLVPTMNDNNAPKIKSIKVK